jgi:hypothetical protein
VANHHRENSKLGWDYFLMVYQKPREFVKGIPLVLEKRKAKNYIGEIRHW